MFMKSSVYISSEKIEVIGYVKSGKNISVKLNLEYPIPEGTMINGRIIDHSLLTEALTSVYADNPKLFADSTLVVDGSIILAKRIILPKLGKRRYERLVREEFKDTAEMLEDLVCDYHSFGKTDVGGASLLGFAVEKAQVEGYLSSFKSAGIKIKAVRLGVQSILKYIGLNDDFKKETFVLNVIDGVTMLSMIFDEGINIFISRTRLYGDDNEELIHNMEENLSRLIQFGKSEKFNDIVKSYYMGLKDEDLELLNTFNHHREVKLETLNIKVKNSEGAELPLDAHFVYLNALLGNNSIDLIKSCKAFERYQKRQGRKTNIILPIAAAAAIILAAPISYLTMRVNALNAQISELNAYLKDENVIKLSNEIDEIIAKTGYYNRISNQLRAKIELEESEAVISNELLDLIMMPLDDNIRITMLDFTTKTGTIRVNGSSSTESYSADYIEMLRRSVMVKDVSYNGYSYNSAGEYTFTIDVKVAVNQPSGGDEK